MNPTFFEQILSVGNLDLIVKIIIVYSFVVWFCIVVWVVKDITNRTSSVLFQIFSVLLVLGLTPLGIFIYLLIRPQKTIFERFFEQEFFDMSHAYHKELEQESEPTGKQDTHVSKTDKKDEE